jgi:hypothetical protein
LIKTRRSLKPQGRRTNEFFCQGTHGMHFWGLSL